MAITQDVRFGDYAELVRRFVAYYRPRRQETNFDRALAKAVAEWDLDPNRAKAQATEWCASDPPRFCEAALRLLQTSGDAALPALRPLLTLEVLLRALLNPEAFSRLHAIGLVRELRRFDSRLDVHLVSAFLENRRKDPDASDVSSAQRILELVDEATDNAGRVLPLLASLQRVEHAWVRSKVVAIWARHGGTSHVTAQLLRDPDHRVRANAIEGLWTTPDTPDKRGIFLQAVGDRHQRVVGNALVGLARMRYPAALGDIVQLSRHSSPEFRATAAWAMGEVGYPGFRPPLVELMRDPDGKVRQNALRALSRLRKMDESPVAALPPSQRAPLAASR
ncbi:MAG: HEAT repeat domain-containing protein [Bryobacteraceae bacterium]|nr:HEAT repeat domain-containing protein [Bryobacteraceae bacterium]